MNVSLLRNTVSTDRAWLDREAMLIEAMISRSSKKKVYEEVLRQHLAAHIPAEVAEEDARLAVRYVEARIAQIREMRKTPPPEFLPTGRATA